MAKHEIEKGSKEFQMFQDFWRLYQTIYEPEYTKEYTDYFCKCCNAFCEKYKDVPMARELTRSVAIVVSDRFTEKYHKTHITEG